MRAELSHDDNDHRPEQSHRLPRRERLAGRKAIEQLFNGSGSRSLAAFPLRLVYAPNSEGGCSRMMVSVPKRLLKHAVDRNRVKRQVREAYRQHKNLLDDSTDGETYVMAFIWIDNRLHGSHKVEARVVKLLEKLSQRPSSSTNGQ